jgi:glycosyl transferase, family 25
MIEQLQKYSLNFSFFDAIIPQDDYLKHPQYQDKKTKLLMRRSLTKGEIGCLLSHRAVWELFLKTEEEYCCVMEDDILLKDNVLSGLEFVLQHHDKWDLVRLMMLIPKPNKTVAEDKQKHIQLIKFPNKQCAGTQAYILNRKAALTLIGYTEHFYLPVDNIIDEDYGHKLRVLSVKPDLVLHDDQIQSVIEGRYTKNKSLMGKVICELIRPYIQAKRFILKKIYF